MSSILAKCSIPVLHSAVAILRLTELNRVSSNRKEEIKKERELYEESLKQGKTGNLMLQANVLGRLAVPSWRKG